MRGSGIEFLGIDAGLTYIKACVFDENGKLLREAKCITPLIGENVDMDGVWKSAAACIREAAEGRSITAIGLSGHGNGLYALDKNGEPLIGVSSMVNSYAPFVKDSKAFLKISHQSCWSGQPLQILRNMKRTNRSLYDSVSCAMLCKDYIRYRLTGEILTDYSDISAACLLDANTNRYSEALFDLTETLEKKSVFPEIICGYEKSACVSRKAAELTGLKEGTPVVGGLFDVSACMIGAGAIEEDTVSVTAGTWGVTAAAVPKSIISGKITQSCLFYDDQTHISVVSAPTSCVNLEWFLKNAGNGISYDEANAIAQSFSPEDVKIMYLPFLYGDMSLPGIGAGFEGLTAEDTWRHMLRAVYEGVMLSHRRQLDRLKTTGISPCRARLSGGAANSALWQKLFADGLRLPVETVREKQVGALGGCMMAAVCSGVYKNVGEAVSNMTNTQNTVYPADKDVYKAKYERFMRRIGEGK